MTHLVRLVSYLGLRGSSRHNPPVFRIQLASHTTRNKRDQMGQATSFISAYANGKDSEEEEPEGKTDKGPPDKASTQENEEKEVEQQAKAGDAEKVLEAAEVSMTNDLDKKFEKELVSEASKPVDVVVEEPVKPQTALNLALAELGEPPERPLPGDCCGQGCDVCVWDTYNDELRDYLARKKALLKQPK